MSFDYNYSKEVKEEYYSEIDSSLFKFTAPISRLKYFLMFVIYSVIFVGVLLFYKYFLIGLTAFRGMFTLIMLPLLIFIIAWIWFAFVNMACRLWDITTRLKTAIVITISVFLVYIFLPGIFKLLIGLLPAFIPGKLLK